MERLDKPQSKDYGPLVIWADDLAEIFSALKTCSESELIADDVKFDSVEEFVKESRGRNPRTVKIAARDPYLTVELGQRWARLYGSSSDLLPSGLFLKLDAILSRCERKPKFFYRYLWVMGCTWLFPNIFTLPPFRPHGQLGLWAAGLTFLWWLYVVFIHLWRCSIVRPLHREARPSFIRRNVDAIVRIGVGMG
jgi:hypothetical protein